MLYKIDLVCTAKYLMAACNNYDVLNFEQSKLKPEIRRVCRQAALARGQSAT